MDSLGLERGERLTDGIDRGLCLRSVPINYRLVLLFVGLNEGVRLLSYSERHMIGGIISPTDGRSVSAFHRNTLDGERLVGHFIGQVETLIPVKLRHLSLMVKIPNTHGYTLKTRQPGDPKKN